jgi:hypothetical protein
MQIGAPPASSGAATAPSAIAPATAASDSQGMEDSSFDSKYGSVSDENEKMDTNTQTSTPSHPPASDEAVWGFNSASKPPKASPVPLPSIDFR